MNGAQDEEGARLPREDNERRSLARAFLELGTVVVCSLAFVLTVVGMVLALLSPKSAGTRDFIGYWASGHQLVHRANPYDGAAMLPMERAAGLPADVPPMVIGNLPSALPLVMPLGFVGARLGELLWVLALIAALGVSVQLIRGMHSGGRSQLHLLGYSFAPALICVESGQASIFVLLGLTLFLRLHRSRPFLAGLSLWFCALKPQLFLPFGVVLLAWVAVGRRYRIVAGAAAALAGGTAMTLLLDPHVWNQYAQTMRATRYDLLPVPCFSIELRTLLNPSAMWIQYMPAFLCCIWALVYFGRRKHEWDWMTHGSLLMLASILAAPYTWLLDQAVLLPALLHGAYMTRSRTLIALLALATASIEIAGFCGLRVLDSAFYLWTSPFWLVWYLLATRWTGLSPGTARLSA